MKAVLTGLAQRVRKASYWAKATTTKRNLPVHTFHFFLITNSQW